VFHRPVSRFLPTHMFGVRRFFCVARVVRFELCAFGRIGVCVMEFLLSGVALAFLAVLVGLASVVFRSKDYYLAQVRELESVRQDLAVVCVDIDFLFCRLADIDSMLDGRSVLGSEATDLVKDWVSTAHLVLDGVQVRLDALKS
jgi:hypothetical protein